MTTQSSILPLSGQSALPAQRAVAVGSPLLPSLLFLVGIKLPLYCPDQTQIGGMLDRVTLVDVFTLMVCGILATDGTLRLSRPILFYIAALLFAFVCGSFSCPVEERGMLATGLFALLMATTYYLIAFSVATRGLLLKPLLMGLLCGVLWQSVIVLHDYFFAAQWFPDRMEHRVRGTFRVSGQLAAYGFSIAAIGITSAAIVKQTRMRHLLFLTGGMGVFMVLAASRRSGILAIAGGILVYLILSCRQWYSTRRFLLPMLVCLVLGIAGYRQTDSLMDSFVGRRITASVNSLTEGGSWVESELMTAVETTGSWFPFGIGTGCGYLLTHTHHEFHNGHLSLLVELGVFGLFAFYGCLLYPLVFASSNRNRAYDAFRTLLLTVIVTAAVFMVHNRLHRDRGFMLFLGLTSGIAVALSAGKRQPQTNHPGQASSS